MIYSPTVGPRRGCWPLTLAALLLCPHFAAAQTNASQSVRLLTYNIHRDIGGSDSNTASQAPLAKVVNFLDPDVWTINEVGGNNVRYNAATAYNDLVTFISTDLTVFGTNPQVGRDYYVYFSARSDGYSTSAIVSRYPFLSTQTYSDAGNGFQALRGLALAEVDLPGATDLGVFTTHMKASDSSDNDGNAEKRQAEADTDSSNIRPYITSHSGEGVVVTGDWNESEDPGDKLNWTGHQVGDPLPSNGEAYHPISTMKSAGLTDPKPVSIKGDSDTISSTSGSPNTRFDYTLYGPGQLNFVSGQVFDLKQYTAAQLAALNAQNGTTFTATDTANASDHLPVLSIFQVTAAPEPSGSVAIIIGIGVLGLIVIRRPAK